MDVLSIILIVLGLCLFETITSIDNAIINAQILSTMHKKSRKWFLLWGLVIAVFMVRGLLPWFIVWLNTSHLGPIDALTATFSNNPEIISTIESSSPILLIGGGVFLLFLFLHWLFLEKKKYGLNEEKFFISKGIWFFAIVSILLSGIVWFAIKINPMMGFSAVVGSTAFFIVDGFKQNAELRKRNLINRNLSDMSKIFYLEILDTTFSIDGVLGAFAFTISVPLIILGNGLGAVIVRHFTASSVDKIKKYVYIKNGAMYSILFLGIIMILESFGFSIPSWVSPVITFVVVGYFFYKSIKHLETKELEKK